MAQWYSFMQIAFSWKIEFEREKSKSEAIYEGFMPEEYEDSYLETLAVYRKIAVGMLQYDTFLMHGAVVGNRSERTDAEGKAVLFKGGLT